MTREEIINEIKSILEELRYSYSVSYLTQNDKKWLEETIKVLEREPLTDKEQRIFLAAMSREEEACKEVCADGSDGGVDLVAVCHRIERKVKKVLWR